MTDARRWCDSMRNNPEIGDAVQELQNWKPEALAKVVAYASKHFPEPTPSGQGVRMDEEQQ